MELSNPITQEEIALFWFNLGQRVCNLAIQCNCIYAHILIPSFGITHNLTKSFYKLNFNTIKSELDKTICAYYPLDITSIIINGSPRKIVCIFYNNASIQNLPKNDYPIHTPRIKTIYDDDMILIKNFLNDNDELCNFILNNTFLKNRKGYYNDIATVCKRTIKNVNNVREMLNL